MICYPLQILGYPFDLSALTRGSRMDDLNVRPECQISDWRLEAIRNGKDASINDMLIGGAGFPCGHIPDQQVELAFDMGCTEEQRDLKSLFSTRSY